MTSAVRQKHAASGTGFTLLELIVVLSILAIAYLLAVPRVDIWSDRRQVDDAVDLIRIEIAKSASQAVLSGKAVSFDAMDAAAGGAVAVLVEPAGPVIVYPDGSATPKRITVRHKDQRRSLTIDWLTGNVAEEPL